MATRAWARWRIVRPRSSATPCSVTTLSTVFFSVVTTDPSRSRGTILLIVPCAAVERQHEEALAAVGVHRPAGEVGLAA